MKYISKSNEVTYSPQCNIKINGNCKNYPNMSNKGYFPDQKYGGPVPTNINSCKNRRNSWIGSCDNKNISMKYISSSDKETNLF